jgi:hypothetical protein
VRIANIFVGKMIIHLRTGALKGGVAAFVARPRATSLSLFNSGHGDYSFFVWS